jgi:hypothetical protein
MPNPWLAIDVATAPRQRARELRSAWERFIQAGRSSSVSDAKLREPIVASWCRSAAAGVDPLGARIAPVIADEDEAQARWEVHPLSELAPLIRSCLAATADESNHLIVVADANGLILWLEGSARVRMRAAESMNFAQGALWSEGAAGTNAIGTALAAAHGVQVFAAEHFNEVVQAWTCAASPVRDPDSGRVIGVIDLTGEMDAVHPHSLAVATATAEAVEAQLRCRILDRDRRLLARYGSRLTQGSQPRALLAPSGRVLAAQPFGWIEPGRLTVMPGGGEVLLADGSCAVAEALGSEDAYLLTATARPMPHAAGEGRRPNRRAPPSAPGRRSPPALAAVAALKPLNLELLGCRHAQATIGEKKLSLRMRHAEILALLCAHPDGLRSEHLSNALYGHAGQTGSVRVEVSRLRALLGSRIDPECYRLTGPISSDLAVVAGLLRRGQVREAIERYRGPLLPQSRAPGVLVERKRLEDWVRQTVLDEGDPEALWLWLQTAGGASDLVGWQQLLRRLAFHDPRRGLAAARVRELRRRAST